MKPNISRNAILLALVCAFALLCVPAGLALADAGGFAGATDFGGSSSSGSSSDSGLGELIYLIIWLLLDVPYGWVIVLIGAVIFGIFVLKGKIDEKKKPKRVVVEDSFDTSKLMDMGYYADKDPNFSKADMREKVSNLYVQMQNAWTAKDFSPMRPYFSDALYAQFDRQLNTLRRRNMTNYVDNITVLGVKFEGWYQEAGQDCLSLKLRTRITDYTVSDQTGEITSGSKKKEKFMTYRWILSRTSGTQTGVSSGTTTVNCPNCAAVLNINKTAKCPYCDSIVTVDQHDWVITAIQGLSQETV